MNLSDKLRTPNQYKTNRNHFYWLYIDIHRRVNINRTEVLKPSGQELL